MSREGSRAGRSREGEVEGGGPRKGSTDHGPNWPKGAGFWWLGQFLGSLVWENHKAEKTLPFPIP